MKGENISGTSVELVRVRLKKGTRKTRSDTVIGLSSSGIYRLVGLSRLSLAILSVFSLSLSQQTLLQLPQVLLIGQFDCGTSRQGSAIKP